mmetsp:Transcript_21094/g.40985  ORF Transcript_21094/g.40985 Transcript_21094/m.40985 type:complete len:196 (-) Transcript_21094:986-1573(-)
MGNTGMKMLPQAQRKTAMRLSSAQEAERQAELMREQRAAEEGSTPDRKYPSMGRPDEDMVRNMHAIMGEGPNQRAILTHIDKSVMPEGAFNPAAKRKLAGRPADGRSRRMPAYGLTETDFKTLFKTRGGIFADTGDAEVVDSQKLAQKFKLREADVHLLLKYFSPVVPINLAPGQNRDEDKVRMCKRQFDTTPNA